MAPSSFPYALHRREALGPGLLRILKSMGQDGLKLAQPTKSELTESIHHLRTLIKRLRAYLWFLRPLLGSRQYKSSQAQLRKAAQRLSEARDHAAVQSALSKIIVHKSDPKNSEALNRVSHAFARKIAPLSQSTIQTREHLQKAANTIVQLIAQTTRTTEWTPQKWTSSDDRLAQALSNARKAKKHIRRKNEAHLIHEWRKKTKRLFYLLQLTQHFSDLNLTETLQKVDALQETLGDHQDNVVAEDHLRNDPSGIDHAHAARTLRLLKKKRKHLLMDARQHWRSLPKQLSTVS